jgi:hypothetical protein
VNAKTAAPKKAPPVTKLKLVPAKAAPAPGGLPPLPPAPPRKRPHVTPLTPLRVQAAKSMSKLADHLKEDNPDHPAHQHVMDAARTLRQGHEEASQRHLRAAIFSLTPQSLMRNGQHTDDLHIAARAGMHGVHRHLLLVKDIEDVAAANRAALERAAYGDGLTAPPHPDPNNGAGPGALAQKPMAREPGGDQAMNAPAKADGGGTDPAAADPGAAPKGAKPVVIRHEVRLASPAFARTWDELASVIELAAVTRPKVVDLVGPKGYIHGWIYVDDVPGLPSVAEHNATLRKKGVTPPTKAHPALTRKPPGVKNPAPKAAAGKTAAAARSRAALAKVNQEKSPGIPPAKVPAAASAPSAGPDTAGALKPGDKIMGAFQPGTGPSAHTVVSVKTDGKTVHLTVKDNAGRTYKSDIGSGEEIVRAQAAPAPVTKAEKPADGSKPDYVFGLIPKAGTQVTHPDHGTGTVISTSGTAVKNGSALVKFKDGTSETFGVDFNRGIEPGESTDGLARAVPNVPVTGAKTMYDLPDAQASAVNKYIGGETERAINDGLRGIGGPPDAKTKRQIATMDKAVQATHLSAPTTLYRGIALRPPGFTFKAGDTFTDSGFTSVSTSPDMAKEFADLAATGKSKIMDAETMGDMTGHIGGTPAVMHFNLPAGHPMGPGDASVGEFILPRGRQYKVTSVNPDGSMEVGLA